MATHNGIVRARKDVGLTTDEASYTPSTYWGLGSNNRGGTSRRGALKVIRKHWKSSLIFAVLVEMLLLGIVLLLHNTYQASATLEIDPPNSSGVGQQNASVSASPDQQQYLDTQIEILRGDHLAAAVIKTLSLDKNPVFLHATWIQRLQSELMAKLGRPASQDDLERFLTIFKNGLSVVRITDSQLVDIQYESLDPQLSMQIVNTVVQQYLEDVHRDKYDATVAAAASVTPEIKQLQQAVNKSNEALVNFQKSHEGVELADPGGSAADGTTNTTSGGTTGNPIATRVSDLNQQLTQAIADRVQQESYVRLISQGQVDTLPQMKDSPLIQQLTERLVDSRAQLADALAIYGSNNPQVRRLRDQTTELDTRLNQERARIADQIQQTYRSAQNRENLLRQTLSGLKTRLDRSNADVVQYDMLQREAQANASLYVALSSRIKEMAVSASLDANNVSVLNNARMPLKPSGPHRLEILGVGLLTGLLGGIALAFIAEGMDDTISSTEDLRQLSDIPALALVPESRLLAGRLRSRLRPMGVANGRKRAFASSPSVLVLHPHSRSPEAEAIRNLETAIRVSCLTKEHAVQTVLVTSSFPGEGKTTVAANLAVALARQSKTCLIDADLRHPMITSTFGPATRGRLLDALRCPDLIQQLVAGQPDMPNLTVLGTEEGAPQAVEALTSAGMADLLVELRKRFDYIVLDSPPIIPFAEARWLSALSDGVVIVARCSWTTHKAVLRSMEILEDTHAPLLGVVLNGADLELEYRSYGTHNYYYGRRTA